MVPEPLPFKPSRWNSALPSLVLVLADAAGFALCWWLAWRLRVALDGLLGPINPFAPYDQVHELVVLVGIANCAFFGLYAAKRRLSSLNKWRRILMAAYHFLLYLMVIGYFFKELDLGRSVILLGGLLAFAYLYASRSAFRWLKARALEQGRGRVRTAIVGTGKLANEVLASLRAHPDVAFEVVGFVGHPSDPAPAAGDAPVLGGAADLARLVREHHLEEVIVAAPHLSREEQLNLIDLGSSPGLTVQLVSDLFGVVAADAKVDEIAQFPVITLRDGRLPRGQRILKRAFDIAVSAAGVAAWLLLLHWWIAWWIRRDSPGPVFFRQTRIGRDGEPFTIWKYRTMTTEAPAYARAPGLPDDPRVTRAGRWLRKTSLDELPQLWNVLRGDMSMVGPRPEMPFIVEQYQAWQRRRLDVKPGITGLWQVIGRKNLPLHLNMEYDFYYIRNQSLLLDLEILIRTVPAVLRGRGAF